MEEKKRLWVQTKMDPCFDKMALRDVVSVCKFGANQNAPCFSCRYRSRGARGAYRTLQTPGQRQRSEVLEQIRFAPNGTGTATVCKDIL